MAIDSGEFRQALGKFPTGVTIITTQTAEGKPAGMTASSFNSVSLNPPLILWSVDKQSESAALMTGAEYFAVNVLSESQMALSNQFASPLEDRFAGVDFSTGQFGSPLLAGSAAQLECKTWQVYDGGDHHIIVGEVLNFSTQATAEGSLVFAGGSYAITAAHPELS